MEWLLTGEGTKRPSFAVIKDGFIFAKASFVRTAAEAGANEGDIGEESKIRFRFLPQDDPAAVSAEQQQAFCARYFEANDEQKRELLGLAGSTEKTVSTRMLGAVGVLMKRHLDGLKGRKTSKL